MTTGRVLVLLGLLLGVPGWPVAGLAQPPDPVPVLTVEADGKTADLRFAAPGEALPEAVVRGGRLVLDFGDRPRPGIGDLETRLRKFVAGVTEDAASGRLLFVLRSGTEVEIARSGSQGLRITFRREEAATAVIGVRTGLHPGFLRIVFEGPEAAAAELARTGPGISLRFARPLDRRVAARLARLDQLAVVEAVDPRSLRLRLAEGREVEILRLPPDRLVLDLSAAKAEPAAAEARDPAASGSPAIAPAAPSPPSAEPGTGAAQETAGAAEAAGGRGDSAAGTPPGRAEVAAVPPRETVAVAAGAAPPASLPAPPPAASPKPPAAVGDDPARRVTEAETAEAEVLEIRAAREGDTVLLRFLWPFEVGAAAFVRAGRLWVVFDARTRSLLAERKRIVFHAGALIRALRQQPHERATVLRIDLKGTPELSMRREGTAWVLLFDRPGISALPVEVDATAGRLLFPGARRNIRFRDNVAGEEVQVLTYRRSSAGLAERRRLVDLTLLPTVQGVAWRTGQPEVRARPVPGGMAITRPGGLRLDPAAFPPREATAPPPAAAGETAAESVAAQAAAPEDGISAAEGGGSQDPAATEIRTARPVPAPGGGGEDPPSPADGDTAAASPDNPQEPRAEMAAEGAGEAPEAATGTGAPAPAVRPAEMEWRTTLGLAELSPEVLQRTARLRRALTAELAMRDDPERQALRLRIARLYLADALSAEAFAQLLATRDAAVIEDDPVLAKRRAALAGASSLLLGRNGVAAEHLRNPLLEEDREVALWKAVLAARENRWGDAAEELERSGDILESYPPPLRFRLGLMAIMIAAQNGDAASAFAWLERLDRLQLTAAQRDELRFIEALTLNRDGAGQEARRLLARLAEEAGWITATKADYALVNLDREADRIDIATARDAFLRQRPFWRGHPWEPAMLRELGRLERALDRLPEALAVWRELLGRYPEAAPSKGVPEEMAATLAAALDPEADPALPLFLRLELYRRYVALLPPGEAGDGITLDLAEGLLEAGLPEVAETLAAERLPLVLDAAMRRAFAWLQARASLERGALGAARETTAKLVATGAGEDALRARLLAARIELARGNPWGALAAVEDIADPRALGIRIDAAWVARDWNRLVALAPLLTSRLERREPVSENETIAALRVGTALWRRGEREKVVRIARLVADRNPSLTTDILFELMTTPVTIGGDPRRVVGAAGELADRLRTRLAQLQAGDTEAPPATGAAGL